MFTIISTAGARYLVEICFYNSKFMAKFQDCVVLVTGGTSGIDLSMSLSVATLATLAKWQAAKRRLSAAQLAVIEYRYCDVRIEAEVQELIHHIFEDYGQLDVCFNNAGVQPVAADDITSMDFESTIAEDGSIIYHLPGLATNHTNHDNSHCLASQKTPVSAYCERPLAQVSLASFTVSSGNLTTSTVISQLSVP